MAWRESRRGLLSDQGTEKGVPQASFGDASEVGEVLRNLEERKLHLFTPKARRIMFLWRCLVQVGVMHIFFNRLQDAIECVPEWKTEELMIKGFAKTCGSNEYKSALLEKCYKHAPKEPRHRMHAFAGAMSGRWEYLEDLGEQIVGVYEDMQVFFDPSVFQGDKCIGQTDTALHSLFFYLYLRIFVLVAKAVGRGSSELEGCLCHPELRLKH